MSAIAQTGSVKALTFSALPRFVTSNSATECRVARRPIKWGSMSTGFQRRRQGSTVRRRAAPPDRFQRMKSAENRMQIAMIGLGQMGANMARRFLKAGHSCVVYARQAAAMASRDGEGAVGTASLAELVAKAATPHAICLKNPAVGTSAGIAAHDRDYCLMICGEAATVEDLKPIFASLAPGVGSAERTSGRSGEVVSAGEGFLRCSPHGAGHFLKMATTASNMG
jgi:3-hydroxyisobutyrate dehydrogenase-like beta-hydroxyacid dehydrogenase